MWSNMPGEGIGWRSQRYGSPWSHQGTKYRQEERNKTIEPSQISIIETQTEEKD